MKRLCCVLMALCIALSFSGCNFAGIDPQTLMSPPQANADQQSIHELLRGGRPDITFIYPKNGEYRSAIIMRDLTGDGVEDALGFFALEDGSVQVQFLIKQADGHWSTASSFQNTATQVDRVLFGDLDADGVEDAIIGWGNASGRTAYVCAYLWSNYEQLNEYSLGAYGEMTVTDFDGNGVKELFTAEKFVAAEEEEEGSEVPPAKARVFAYRDRELKEVFSTDVDNNIINYSSISFGPVASQKSGVILDGSKADGSLTTQLFLIHPDTGLLYNSPAGVNTKEYLNPYSRPPTAPFLSRDINGDGIIEVPVVTPLPALAGAITPDSTSYQVEWSVFHEGESPRTVAWTLMNLTENYYFSIPYSLRGKITASNDAFNRTVTYTALSPGEEGEEPLLDTPLFQIRVFTRSAWQSRGEVRGYEQLAVQNDLIYAFQVLTAENKYNSSLGRIKESFRLLSE